MFFALLALVAPLAAAMTITTGDNAKYLSVHTDVLWNGVGQGDHLVLCVWAGAGMGRSSAARPPRLPQAPAAADPQLLGLPRAPLLGRLWR